MKPKTILRFAICVWWRINLWNSILFFEHRLKRSIDELNTAWAEFFGDVDLSATEKDSNQNLPQSKVHVLLRNPSTWFDFVIGRFIARHFKLIFAFFCCDFSDFLRYIQEKRADYIPRMGRRSGSSQEKEEKVEFYTPRLGRSYSGNFMRWFHYCTWFHDIGVLSI